MTDSLLSRLEALTKPNREIDEEIALANGWKCNAAGYWNEPGSDWWRPESADMPPRYTESLDAALTLVPEGLGVCIGRPLPKYCPGWYAELFAEGWGADPNLFWSDSRTKPRGKDDYAPSPAIALLIAIMKAKEESKK